MDYVDEVLSLIKVEEESFAVKIFFFSYLLGRKQDA